MPRYFMWLAYNGTSYHGWQVQPGGVASVQGTLEDALGKLLRVPTPVTGAGRTDAGVHARRMTAHFDTAAPLPDGGVDFVRRVNAIVGRDIAVESVVRVADDAHARFDARSRTYHYYCHTSKSPFAGAFSWQGPATLDFGAMNRAARQLIGTHDFTSFAKLHSDARTNICTVTEVRWEELAPGRHVFVITADRFLRNMVRAVTGTLVEVGRGKLTEDGFARVIAIRDRCAAGTSMPAHALFLWDVTYDDKILPV